MTLRPGAWAVALLAGAAACEADFPSSEEPEQPPASPYRDVAATAALRSGCPALPGTTITVEDTDTGVALELSTGAGSVEELRERVSYLARMYEQHGDRGRILWSAPGAQPEVPPETEQELTPAAVAWLEPIDGGTRLFLEPFEPHRADDLREAVRVHAERLRDGDCWTIWAD